MKTPIELKIPLDGIVDHGLEAAHYGSIITYVHDVSVNDSDKAARCFLNEAGYKKVSGWENANQQMLLYRKVFPQTVGNW